MERHPRRPLGGLALVLAVAMAATPLIASSPAAADTGGPDNHGYVWVDSRPPSPVVPYSWVNIVPTGTRLSLGYDDCTFELPIGFQFRFYGTIVDRLYVCANGFLSISFPTSYDALPPIPDPMAPNDRIVGLGMNLDPSADGSGGVYVKTYAATTPRRFVATWDGVYKELTTTRETFQIILEQNQTSKDGRILFQYKSIAAIGTPLVGIENRTGSSGLAYPNALENGLAVAFLPPSDAGLPPDTLTVTPGTLAPGFTEQGADHVPMLGLALATASNDVSVAAVRVELSGLGADAGDVAAASLWLDDGDGAFAPANDTLLGEAGFSGTPPMARVPAVPSLRVAMGTGARAFVTYTIAPDADVGDWVGARMRDASFVEVEFPDNVTTFSINTYMPNVRTRIDASVDTLLVTSATGRMPSEVAQWQADVPALALTVDADRNLVDLAGFRFDVGGGASASDLWLAKLVRDADRDGNFTRGTDEVLAVAAASGTPPSVFLPFAMTLAAGSPVSFLAFADVGPSAVVGRSVNLTLPATGVVLAAGSADLVGGANLPAASGDATIRAGLRPRMSVAWTDIPPSADGTWGFGEHLLGPAHTADLGRPIGNGIPALLTVENNGTMLFVAVDALADPSNGSDDGLAVGFDTDGNGAPTDGADDVFVANASAGAHLRYSVGAGAWTVVSACAASGGNVTTPACAASYGRTELVGSDHRFYEFAIPLSLLGVPTPVLPGASIRFAVAAPPHRGLVDDGNRSTWPLLYPAAPPLGTFADLSLAAAPVPNIPPTLDWTGEAGYVADGLEPETADAGMPFRYRIAYADVDEDPPAIGHPRVRIYRDGVELAASPVAMSEVDPGDTTYGNGKLYVATVVFPACGGNYTYAFLARDVHGAFAAGTWTGTGPVVTCPNFAPTLSSPGVLPTSAQSGSAFAYRVAYADPEDVPPVFAEVLVRLDGSDLTTQPLLFAGWLGVPGDYAAGAWYEGSVLLTVESSNYTFRFRASDGNTLVFTDEYLGPQVVPPPPDILRTSFGDIAPPFVVDAGARNVPFLRMLLWTSDPDVNVSGVRIDRTGDLPDIYVESVTLYEDVDVSGTLSGPDLRLGVLPPTLGFVDFTVDLRISPSTAIGLLVYANLTTAATADALLGFEVAGPSAFRVAAGDAVQSFPAFPSTRVRINVAPRVEAVRMDGYAPGSPGASHILRASPPLSWTFRDDNGGDLQDAYNVSVFSLSPPGLVWFLNASAANQSVPYGGPPLAPGASYVVQVRVFDGRLWSGVAAATFRRNSPPAAPALVSPADLAVDVDPNATLAWSPVTDGELDPITYTWWVSDSPAFLTATSGVVSGSGIAVSLALDTQYYWKVGASDGWEFAGNATIGRFATAGEPVPVRGEIRGRVVNGTTPLAGSLVEILVGTSVVTAAVTPENGTFSFRNLDMRTYAVRVSAFGFRARTLNATPTLSTPVIDLGDLALTPLGGGNGGNGNHEPPPVAWLPIAIPAVLAAAALVAFLLMFRRRRLREPDESVVASEAPGGEAAEPGTASAEPEIAAAPPPAVGRPLEAGTPEAAPVRAPAAVAPRREAEARPTRAPEAAVPEGALVFECPLCGRRVAADTRICLCGAEFEA